MSSSVQSVDSASTELVRVAHPLNHVNHNHPEPSSPKSLKRTRSPSLTREDPPNEIRDETPTKKSRKKRNTTDIDQSLGCANQTIISSNRIVLFSLDFSAHLSADKLHIYRWPTGEPHADLHVLQEQICDYLSLKSFKRKYPG